MKFKTGGHAENPLELQPRHIKVMVMHILLSIFSVDGLLDMTVFA